MEWFTMLGWIAALACGIYWGRRARANLSDEGKARPFRTWFLGAWAPRRAFTDLGWRYQQRAIWGALSIWLLTLIITAALE